MGQKFSITIDSINNGQQAQEDFPIKGGYNFSIAIDPDLPANLDDSVSLSSGMITPAPFLIDSNFASGADANSPILNMFMSELEDVAKLYVIDTAGEVNVAEIDTSSTGTWTNPDGFTVGSSGAGGAVYYKDFIYVMGTQASNNDVGRFGPLSGTPTEDGDYWTNTLSLAAINDEYVLPEIDNVPYPKHWGYVHIDDILYFADFVNDQGVLHKIQTDSSGVNTGAAFNVLDLPQGYKITCFASWGNDLVIGAMKWSEVTNAPNAIAEPALFFWDTISDSFYNVVKIREWSALTALENKGGILYCFGGTVDGTEGGHGIAIYNGSQAIQQLQYLPYGHSPFAGATAVYGDRISWGTRAQFIPNNDRAIVLSMGSKDPRVSSNAIQCIGKSTADTDDVLTTALIYPYQDSGIFPRIIAASHAANGISGNDSVLEQVSTSATQDSTMEFGQFNIGEPFRIDKIRILLGESVASGVTITPSLLFDDRQDTYTLPVINNTNYSGKRNVVFKKPELTNQSGGEVTQGEHNFLLKFDFTGTTPTSIKFPITIEGTTIDD